MPVVIRAAFLLLAFCSAAHAAPGTYVVQCTASCVAIDGTTQPAGTALNRIVADPDTFNPGTGLTLVPDTGQAIYQPPVVAKQIGALDFIGRFTTAEQQAIQSAGQSNWQVQLWMTQLAAAGTVNVTDTRVTTGMAQLVTLGLLTQQRSDQILNLGTKSP
jgi:hypothetical protein